MAWSRWKMMSVFPGNLPTCSINRNLSLEKWTKKPCKYFAPDLGSVLPSILNLKLGLWSLVILQRKCWMCIVEQWAAAASTLIVITCVCAAYFCSGGSLVCLAILEMWLIQNSFVYYWAATLFQVQCISYSHTRQEVFSSILFSVFFPGKAVVWGMLSQPLLLTFWAGLVCWQLSVKKCQPRSTTDRILYTVFMFWQG